VTRRPIVVVAALIEREGLILIGQRKSTDTHPFKWEFPGGKVERGESPIAALERELWEELSIRAKIGREVVRYEHQYANRPPLLLIFHLVHEYEGEPACTEFEQIRWEAREKLPRYDFLEGDADLVRRLARREF
jgi:8-oxo-dGTP diphosphatase